MVRWDTAIRYIRAVAEIGPTGNLVLQDTVERLFVQNLYADIERGLFLVRGENVLLLGEIVRSEERPSDKACAKIVAGLGQG